MIVSLLGFLCMPILVCACLNDSCLVRLANRSHVICGTSRFVLDLESFAQLVFVGYGVADVLCLFCMVGVHFAVDIHGV